MSCFDCLAYSMFTFDVLWGIVSISIFGTQVQPQVILDPDCPLDYQFLMTMSEGTIWTPQNCI